MPDNPQFPLQFKPQKTIVIYRDDQDNLVGIGERPSTLKDKVIADLGTAKYLAGFFSRSGLGGKARNAQFDKLKLVEYELAITPRLTAEEKAYLNDKLHSEFALYNGVAVVTLSEKEIDFMKRLEFGDGPTPQDVLYPPLVYFIDP